MRTALIWLYAFITFCLVFAVIGLGGGLIWAMDERSNCEAKLARVTDGVEAAAPTVTAEQVRRDLHMYRLTDKIQELHGLPECSISEWYGCDRKKLEGGK